LYSLRRRTLNVWINVSLIGDRLTRSDLPLQLVSAFGERRRRVCRHLPQDPRNKLGPSHEDKGGQPINVSGHTLGAVRAPYQDNQRAPNFSVLQFIFCWNTLNSCAGPFRLKKWSPPSFEAIEVFCKGGIYHICVEMSEGDNKGYSLCLRR
jgi:hypothetical protein